MCKNNVKSGKFGLWRQNPYISKTLENWRIIEYDDFNILNKRSVVSEAIKYIKTIYPKDRNAMLLLKATRLITLHYRKKDELEDRIEYAKYMLQENVCRELFKTLRNTWKNIVPHREYDKLCSKIGDAQHISNGERDIIVFIANLHKAKWKMKYSRTLPLIR